MLSVWARTNRSAFARSVRGSPLGEQSRSATGERPWAGERPAVSRPEAGDVRGLKRDELRLDAIEHGVGVAHDLPTEIIAAREGGERREVGILESRAIGRTLRRGHRR